MNIKHALLLAAVAMPLAGYAGDVEGDGAPDFAVKQFQVDEKELQTTPQDPMSCSMMEAMGGDVSLRLNTLAPTSSNVVDTSECQTLICYYKNIYTSSIISGKGFGTQAVYDNNNKLLWTNAFYSLVVYNGTNLMVHQYADCVIYTDKIGQIIVYP